MLLRFVKSIFLKHSKNVFAGTHLNCLNGKQKLSKNFQLRIGKTKRRADIIYLFEYNDQSAMLLLSVEQQSKADKLLPLRQANYLSSALLDYCELNKTKQLPTVLSIVYYTGHQTPYPYPNDSVFDLFNDQAFTMNLVKPMVIDIGQIDDQQLLTHRHIAPAEIAYKYTYAKIVNKDKVALFFSSIKQQISQADDDEIEQIIKIAMTYCIETWNYDEKQFLKAATDYLPTVRGDLVDTIAQQIQQKGMQIKAEQIACNLLKKGMGIAEVAEISELPLESVKKIQTDTNDTRH